MKNINKYFEKVRSLTWELNYEEEPLALLFYICLNPNYQEDFQKLDSFPETLENIITKWIPIENTMKTTNKIRETANHIRNKKYKKNHNYNNNNYKNKNRYHNNYRNNYQSRNNSYNIRSNNIHNESSVKAQKNQFKKLDSKLHMKSMKFNANHNKINYYNFPTFDSNTPKTITKFIF